MLDWPTCLCICVSPCIGCEILPWFSIHWLTHRQCYIKISAHYMASYFTQMFTLYNFPSSSLHLLLHLFPPFLLGLCMCSLFHFLPHLSILVLLEQYLISSCITYGLAHNPYLSYHIACIAYLISSSITYGLAYNPYHITSHSMIPSHTYENSSHPIYPTCQIISQHIIHHKHASIII